MSYYSAGDFVRSDSVLQTVAPRESRFQAADRLSLQNTRAALAGDRMAVVRASEELRRIMPGAEADAFLAEDLLQVNRVAEALALLKGVNPDHGWLKGWSGYWNFLAASYHMTGDYQAALAVTREGRRRFPNESGVLGAEVVQLAALGKVAELQHEIDQWVSVTPALDRGLRSALGVTGQELRAHGHAAEGKAFAIGVLATLQTRGYPDTSMADQVLFASLFCQAESWRRASAVAQAMEAARPTNPDGMGYFGVTAARMGDTLAARSAARLLDGRHYPYSFGRPQMWRARIAAVEGDQDRAVALIHAAIRDGYSEYWALHRIPEFESLQAYPPFIALLKPAG